VLKKQKAKLEKHFVTVNRRRDSKYV